MGFFLIGALAVATAVVVVFAIASYRLERDHRSRGKVKL